MIRKKHHYSKSKDLTISPSATMLAVPGNRQCGVSPPDLAEDLQRYCRKMEESPQG